MHAWMKMLRRTRYTKRKKHTLQPKYKVARMKSYFVLTLNPAQCKRTTVTNTIYFRLWEKLNLKNSVSVSAHVRNSSFPSHQESCPPSNSSSTLPPVWSFWNTNVSRLLPCLHHFDIYPFLQCFQIEFKLPDIKDSHDLIPDFFTSFIFNYSSSPLPSKLLFSILQTLKNTCCYKRPFHGVVLRICIHFSLYLVKCPLFLFFLMNFHLSFMVGTLTVNTPLGYHAKNVVPWESSVEWFYSCSNLWLEKIYDQVHLSTLVPKVQTSIRSLTHSPSSTHLQFSKYFPYVINPGRNVFFSKCMKSYVLNFACKYLL